jgi:DNA-directed RNA polymerase
MIPRRARSLLTSRQALPRPARLFSTPTKPLKSATATATAPSPIEYPPLISQTYKTPNAVDMHHFLRRKTAYTLLPTPLPDDRSSSLNDFYFTDSPTQDTLAIISACLHGLHDVPRAKEVFDRLRKEKPLDAVLEHRLYNSMLEAYVNMASSKGVEGKNSWIQETLELFNAMEHGKERVGPTESTYAIMLMVWHRFNPRSTLPSSELSSLPRPEHLLTSIVERNLSISHVITDRVFTSSDEVAGIIKSLSQAAVDLNMSRVVSELGQNEIIGQYSSDPLEGVPEAIPVRKAKASGSVEGDTMTCDLKSEVKSAESEMEVPFNLDNLRRHLAQVTLARRVLPEDVTSRQKLLEESVYDVALERLRHQMQTLEGLGLGSAALNKSSELQKWMWDWHCKLKTRLEDEIQAIIKQEDNIKKESYVPLGPFLSLVAPERLSLIAILEVMRLQGSGGVAEGMKTTRALISIGKAVENEYKARMCKKNNIQVPSSLLPRGAGAQTSTGRSAQTSGSSLFSQDGYSDLHKRRVTARKYMEDAEQWTTSWTQGTRAKVGSILVECLMDMAEVTRVGKDKVTGEPVCVSCCTFFAQKATDNYIRPAPKSSPLSSILMSISEVKNWGLSV